jgi:hypothetical protein
VSLQRAPLTTTSIMTMLFNNFEITIGNDLIFILQSFNAKDGGKEP